MPSRILRDGILSSERVNSLEWDAEVFYRRLMSVVDDYGRFTAHPTLLRASVYPLKLDQLKDSDIERLLQAVENAGLVRRYAYADKTYIEMLDFRQHVRAKESKYPQPPSRCNADAQQMISNVHLGGDVVVVVDVVEDVCEVSSAKKLSTGKPENPLPLPAEAGTPHKTQLDPEFKPNDANQRTATGASLDLPSELERFIAHYQATGDYRTNWQAQFRKWLLDSQQQAAERGKRAAAPGRGETWRANEDAALKKGAELGISPRSGESWNDFRARIDAKLTQPQEARA